MSLRVDWPTLLCHPDDVEQTVLARIAEHVNVKASDWCPRGKAYRFAPMTYLMPGVPFCEDCGQFISQCECIVTTEAS